MCSLQKAWPPLKSTLLGGFQFSSVQFILVAQSCLIFCEPMDCSTPGFPVHHQLLELAQIHIHWVGDAIQPSHPLLSPSPPAFNLSQHQGLFMWVSFSHQGGKVLDLGFNLLEGLWIRGKKKKVKVLVTQWAQLFATPESELGTQLYPTLCNPTDCSPPPV